MITYLGFRLVEGLIARVPRRLAYALGVVISTLAFPLLARQRKALESNLRHVRPDLAPPQLRKLAWQNWLNYTKAWIDFFKIPRMDRTRLVGLLTPIGVENLDLAMARGKGVIVVAPHMGSWELAAASWAASFGLIGVMAEQIEPRRLFNHVFRARSKMGIKVIPLSQTGARDIIRMLKDGRMVVLAMDRDILNTGRPFNFFGMPARFPTGPVEIALKTGAPILPAYCVRDKDDRYVAVGGSPLFLTKSEDHAADVRSAMEGILRTFEGYIKMYPDQWHVLEPIWDGAPEGAVTMAKSPAQAAVGDQGGSVG
ncbi:MAG: phosphatidylinositol mannoside acyltransferase [Candidatus Dormibacteria bacterium]